jgi:hypothetical protein
MRVHLQPERRFARGVAARERRRKQQLRTEKSEQRTAVCIYPLLLMIL